MKEVYLQRYLESLLSLFSSTIPFTCFLWQNLTNLGQIVLQDIYNCNAIYALQNATEIYDDVLEPKLTLIKKESQLTTLLTSADVSIPPTVVSKLQSLMESKHKHREEDCQSANNDDFKYFLQEQVFDLESRLKADIKAVIKDDIKAVIKADIQAVIKAELLDLKKEISNLKQ